MKRNDSVPAATNGRGFTGSVAATGRGPELKTCNVKPEIRNPKSETRNSKFKIRNSNPTLED
jgi:hypothetical protein